MISVTGLTKRYGGFTAVDDISFEAKPGLVTGFLGPNGAGKSTTMRMMSGLTIPTKGRSTIGGSTITTFPTLAVMSASSWMPPPSMLGAPGARC